MQTPFTAPGRSGPAATSTVKLPTAGGDARRNWQSIVQLASAVAGQAGANADLQSQIANFKPIARLLDTLHPFKIYQLPSVLRAAPDPTTDWLKFLIRAGNVLGSDATGTDAVDSDPDSETYPTAPTEIVVPINTAQFWFWLEINGGAAVVRYGPTPTASSYGSSWTSTNPWTTAPVPDSQHIPIGWVDTYTNAATYTPGIRQLLRGDVVTVGSGGSSSGIACTIRSLGNGDWLDCVKVSDGSPIKVAKAVPARGGSSDNNTTGPGGEAWYMQPSFNIGDMITALPVDHTGVTVIISGSSYELTYVESNTEREWVHPVNTVSLSGYNVYVNPSS